DNPGDDAHSVTAEVVLLPDTDGQSLEWWADVVLPTSYFGDLQFIALTSVPDTYGRYHQDGMSYPGWFENVRHERFAPIPSSGVHHFVATRRTGGSARLYVDGALAGEESAHTYGYNTHLMIGGRQGLGYAGRLGHVAVYATELTAQQVADHYDVGL